MKRDNARILALAALALLGIAALFLRFYRISDPIAGFHAFNEGFYYEQAVEELARGPFAWLFDPIDYNNPPLYNLLLTTVFRIFGPSIALARTVSVLAGLAAVAVTYGLGRALYNTRVAVFAAAFVAVVPGFVLVSRNNQVDTLMVALQTASVLAYVLAITRKDTRYAWLGGGLLGLALLAKLPAGLMLPSLAIWETWRTRGMGWVKQTRVRAYLAGSVIVGVPWYAIQVARNTSGYLSAQAGVGGQAELMDWESLVRFFVQEWYWLFSPLAALVALVGLGLLARDRHFGDKLILVMAGVQAVFYLFFHFHSYYLVAFVPFVALAAGRVLNLLVDRAPRTGVALASVTLVSMLLLSATMLNAVKFSEWAPQDVRALLGEDASDVNMYVPDFLAGNYGPSIDLAFADVGRLTILPPDVLIPDGWAPEEGKREIVLVPGLPLVSTITGQPAPTYDRLESELVGIALFGTEVRQVNERTHFFKAEGFESNALEAGPLFGFVSQRVPSDFFLYEIRALVQDEGP